MGCCTNLAHFLNTVGIGHFLAPQPKLHFLTPDGRRSVFKADPWPAPFHLGRALMGAHYLTPTEKLRVAWGMLAMLCEKPDADPPLMEWLLTHKQTHRTIERFWGVVLVSALNETVDRLGLKYARKVFRDGFLRHRDGFVVHIPTVPLGRLYGEELRGWFARNNVEVRENTAVRRLFIEARSESYQSSIINHQSSVKHILLRDNTTLTADWYVLAVPFERVPDLLPEELLSSEPYFGNIRNLTPSPIASVHLWFDKPVMSRAHAALVECLGQWVFNRGEPRPGEFYLQVVISAARSLRELGRDEIIRLLVAELARVFPLTRQAKLLRSKVVTEHAATFSAVPGVDRWRPQQTSPLANLVLAGDYTATGWPATMEGAVRSGYLAAEAILAQAGRPERVLRPDLGG
jgi:squalene-associated FAD-dependent desaturase